MDAYRVAASQKYLPLFNTSTISFSLKTFVSVIAISSQKSAAKKTRKKKGEEKFVRPTTSNNIIFFCFRFNFFIELSLLFAKKFAKVKSSKKSKRKK